jgi:RNA polymerase sigma factor (sigma-70 family)
MAGWEDVLDRLVRERGPALVGRAYLLTGDLREAEDLVQDALVKVFARGRPAAEIQSAEAYVRTAIHTIYVDGFRRRRHWATIRHLAALPEQSVSAGPELLVGNRVLLAGALQALTPRERTCVVLHHLEDRPVDEIAGLLSLSTGSVKRYLADGRAKLRDHLGPPSPPSQRSPGESETIPTLTTNPRRTR